MKIDRIRWNKAQQKELSNWLSIDGTVENETEELLNKYSKFLTAVSNKIGLRKNWKVLDIGCGATCVSRIFKCKTKMGIDPLADGLGISNKKIGGVLVQKGIAENLQYPDSFFDLVICRNVLDHCQNPQKAVKEANRVLKTKGVFILSCYIHPKFIVFLKDFNESLNVRRNIEHPFSFTSEKLEKLCSPFFDVFERKIIFEGKHSTDYGKVGFIKKDKSVVNKIIIELNKILFKNNWFVRELALVLIKK